MTEYEIANWLTPGLTPVRLVFISYGGSAHGVIRTEAQDVDSGEWSEIETVSGANGIPEAVGEKISNEHMNQFTGDVVK
jgi:hypothetical protein